MRVEIVAALSLDGYIARVRDQVSLDWTSEEDTQFFIKKTKEAGAMVMGRTTYETIGRPLPGRLMFVLTSAPDEQEDIEGKVKWVSATPQEIVQMAEDRGYESLVVAGGARVYTEFLRAGVVTDLFLTYEPIVFGSGVSFLQDLDPQTFTLVESEILGQGLLTHFRV